MLIQKTRTDRMAFNAYLQISGRHFCHFFEHFVLGFELATLLLGVQEVSLHYPKVFSKPVENKKRIVLQI